MFEHGEDTGSASSSRAAADLPSLSERWSYQHDLAPMPWSFGILGDLVWNVFPQLRPMVRDLVVRQIDDAVLCTKAPRTRYGDDLPSDDQLSPPRGHEFLTDVLRPGILDYVVNGTATSESIYQLCSYLRLALSYSGSDASIVTQDVEYYILENIGTPDGISAIARHDPELVGFIRGQLGMWQA